jgi:hypothetical protein
VIESIVFRLIWELRWIENGMDEQQSFTIYKQKDCERRGHTEKEFKAAKNGNEKGGTRLSRI